jgi:hypothetical protein
VTDIDYDQLRASGGGDPPPGSYDAALVRAALVGSPTQLVTEWQISYPEPYYWTAWFGFEGRRLAFTQDFLDAIELADGQWRSIVSDDDQFEEALGEAVGTVYRVRVDEWSGGVNTYVDGPAANVQEELPEVPIDVEELPPPPAPESPQPVAAGRTSDDDDIPF